MAKTKSNDRFPRITAAEIEKITDAIAGLPPRHRRPAAAFIEESMGARQLCEVLHAIRRWYTFQTGSMARRIMAHREPLSTVMDLSMPSGAFRGFKVDRGSDMAELEVGQRVTLPVSRNGQCSSWTLDQNKANLFSGASKTKVGLVVQLLGGDELIPFLAPPSLTQTWFDELYKATMGTSFRFKEEEVAIHGEELLVQVVRVKCR